MGPRWPKSSCGSGTGLMAALSYSSPSRPCGYKSAMVESPGSFGVVHAAEPTKGA
jgi:hypothetical protein